MTLFFLARHAAFDGVGHRLAGRSPGVHLSAEGREQAERLARRLADVPFDAIYASPLERAQETASAIARGRAMDVRTDDALTELDFGEWTGRDVADLDADERWRWFNRFRSGTRVPGGELMLEAQARAIDALHRLKARHVPGTVLVVSHSDVIRGVVAHYAGIAVDMCSRVEVELASVSVVEVEDWGARIVRLNDTGAWPTCS